VPGGPWISRWLQSTRLIASIARAISSGSSPMPVYFDLAGGFKRVHEHRTSPSRILKSWAGNRNE
jgi:hypothetical protein